MKFAVLVCSMAIGAMADEMGPCSLCPPGVPVINVDVVFPGTDPGGPQLTCGDLETLAPLIGGQAGSEECDALASVGGLCCEGLAECTLCEGGAPPGTPDLVLPGTDQTCGDFEFLVLAIPEDQCDSALTGSGGNLPDICNCPAAETPSPTPAPTVPPTPAPTVPPTPAPTVPPTPAPTVPPTPSPVVPPTPAPVVPPTPAPVVPPTPAPVVPPTPAPVEPPTATPAPVEPPTATPAPVEPTTTTPAPVEPPTTTPAPVEPPTTTPAPVEPPTTTPAPVEPPTTTPAPVEPLPPETSPPGQPEVSTDLIVTLIGTVAAQFPIPAYETACTSFMVANYPNITNILCTVTATSSLRARRLRELQSESLDVFTTVSGESMDPDALSMVDTTISENSDEFVSLLQAENSLAFANVTGVEAAGVDPPTLGSDAPSDVPSDMPSDTPSDAPSDAPSDVPSSTPTPEPDTDLCSSSKSKKNGKGMQSSKSSKSGKGKGGKGCKKSKKKKKTMSSSSSMDSKIRRRHI